METPIAQVGGLEYCYQSTEWSQINDFIPSSEGSVALHMQAHLEEAMVGKRQMPHPGTLILFLLIFIDAYRWMKGIIFLIVPLGRDIGLRRDCQLGGNMVIYDINCNNGATGGNGLKPDPVQRLTLYIRCTAD